MAANATIFKAELQIADMDRHYYETHALTIARHPSETDERMMMRVLAFALYANEALTFGRGLSTEDEPDLWQKDLTGVIDLWIQVGQPEEREIRRACGKARQVVVVCYGSRGSEIWWNQSREKLGALRNLAVLSVPPTESQALAALVSRSMKLQCNIQEQQVWISNDLTAVSIEPAILLMPVATDPRR